MENKLPDIKQSIIIEAPIQQVWQQVSTSEGIAEWFMPNDFKPEVGYEFHLQSPFGSSPCKVTEFDPPNRLSFTWDTEGWYASFILKELVDKTEFTLIHGGWKRPDETIEKAGQKASVIHETMSKGWAGIVQKLKQLVEG
ncbi:SRPBCC domain-containing protein [Neobacillus sp. YIM B02564]|uniref:SRPBCC domain-containing protein n=1 Tax=Neobacillus paridis TaxID=2803862 RepID=A0ABS1TJX1_9BACI|nr:SRPBCC domain-containing protein [Neobacillus paridis]MBL4951483.1 SRPBCC domain-containing protein [Neobacillus paridis]